MKRFSAVANFGLSSLKLIVILVVAFSLSSLGGAMSKNFQLPTISLARANAAPCAVTGVTGACSELWTPAGPAMNTAYLYIYAGQTNEINALESGSVDFTDTACTGTPSSGVCGYLTQSSSFQVSAPTPTSGFAELDFMLNNTFWNCAFNGGNSACGVQIRQGIAHMTDKNQFCSNSFVAGTCTPVDNPESIPESCFSGSHGCNDTLPSPNPCGYDTSFPQSGSSCIVGAHGGTAYHLGSATGADGYPWLYAPGSPDLNAAAKHFVSAGVATGFNNATSVLTNPVIGTTPQLFIRNDNEALRQFGESLYSQICYLFTGSYGYCSYLNVAEGPITAFPGFTTSTNSVNRNWWLYTAGFGSLGNGGQLDLGHDPSQPFLNGDAKDPFDSTLYFLFNSRFVSASCSSPDTVSCTTQQIGGGYCSNLSVQTADASDYMYLCDPSYDNFSNQMETSTCLTSSGDPGIGQPNNGPGGDCTGTSQLSMVSAGIQAEVVFGENAFAIPLYGLKNQFGYLNNGWNNGVINSATGGVPNSFTWLNAWNSAPIQAGAIRVGLSETTRSVNPYVASTAWDMMVVGNIYDSLYAADPLNPEQIFNWMTLCYTPGGGCSVVSENNATVIGTEGFTPPPSTVLTYKFTLNPSLYFQDGRQVTAYDVAFSYLSMVGSGALIGAGTSAMTGVTVTGPRTFFISVSSTGPFEVPDITSIPIVPGRYWSGAGETGWFDVVSACTGSAGCPKAQYALIGATVYCPTALTQPGCTSPAPGASIMQVDPSKITATYDPIANHALVGSGPWECGPVTTSGSGPCSTTGAMNPPTGDSYTLTRFGCTSATSCLAPASSTSGIYFRSSGDLALYEWTQENDLSPLIPISAVGICINQAIGAGACAHWQQGIGANTATGTTGCTSSQAGCVTVNQYSEVLLRYELNWLAPFEWTTGPPLGIVSTPPTLYEGSVTLTPCPTNGSSPPGSSTGYDC